MLITNLAPKFKSPLGSFNIKDGVEANCGKDGRAEIFTLESPNNNLCFSSNFSLFSTFSHRFSEKYSR